MSSTQKGVRHTRSVSLFAALALLLSMVPLLFTPDPALGIGAEPEAPITNPDLGLACGIDILLVLDETGSMEGEETEMEAAYDAFINAMVDTGSRIGVADFSARNTAGNFGEADAMAGAPDDVSYFTAGYITVTPAAVADAGTLGSYTGTEPDGYEPDGYTNWQEALWGADNFEATYGDADLVVFFTDGNPNTVDANTPGYSGTNGELGDNETERDAAAAWAVEYSNDLKDAGTHVLGLGLGLDQAGSQARLASVTGPNGATNPGGFDVSTTDYVTFNSPAGIGQALKTIATALCNTTLNVTKYIPATPSHDWTTGSGFVTANGWDFDITEPTTTGDGVTMVTGLTDTTANGGKAQFKWSNNVRGSSSSTTLDETLPDGWAIVGAVCQSDQMNDQLPFDVTYSNGWAIPGIPDLGTVNCSVYNEAAFLTLEKEIVDNADSGASASDFTVGVSGEFEGPANRGPELLPGGSYTIYEVAPAADEWIASGWQCTPDAIGGNAVTNLRAGIDLDPGDDVTCTILNKSIAPELTLEKKVINDDGGKALDTAFNLKAVGPETIEGKEGDAAITDAKVKVGKYVLSEVEDPDYANEGWMCALNGADPAAAKDITLELGDSAVCEVTNNDKAPGLTVYKDVTNEWGGELEADDFVLTVTPKGGDAVVLKSGESLTSPQANVLYEIGETTPVGYMLDKIVCDEEETDEITLTLGESSECTVYNSDKPGSITVHKVFAHETSRPISDFELFIGDDHVTSGEENLVAKGTYKVTEGTEFGAGWVMVNAACYEDTEPVGTAIDMGVEVDVGIDQHIDCYITNGKLPTIKVSKEIASGNPVAMFKFNGDLPGLLSDGESFSRVVEPGAYAVSEEVPEGWKMPIVECTGGAEGEGFTATYDVNYGDVQTCKFTNSEVDPGMVRVVKETLNDDAVTEFTFTGDLEGRIRDGESLEKAVPFGTSVEVTEVLATDGPDSAWFLAKLTCEADGGTFDIDKATGKVTMTITEAGGEVTCTYGNDKTVVRASVLVTVGASCVLEGTTEVGSINVDMSVANGATVVVEDGGTTVGTFTDDGSIGATVGKTYQWTATANEAANFEFPPGFVPSGEVTVPQCQVPFTGIYADELAFLAGGLLLTGFLALLAVRRRKGEGLDR